MNLQKMSYTELKALFDTAFKNWQKNNLEIERVRERECVKFSDFARSRADFRHLAKKNALLHDLIVRIDLEMQIRAWTGLND